MKTKKIIGTGTVLRMANGFELQGDQLECGHVVHFAEDRGGNIIHHRKRRKCVHCEAKGC